MKRAVAYIRKSTYGSDEGGLERQEGSFDRQRAAIYDYAKRNDLEITKWYEEPVSGKSIRKRKIFLQMVRDSKSPMRGFDHIIFGEYDRFMRHVKEAMRYEVELDDAGIKLHFTNLKNDGSTADQIYKSVVREMAAEYSRELARKVIQGMYRKAKKGSWLGGVTPYGYKKIKENDGKISLAINEEQAEIIRKIYNLSLDGWGHKTIARSLNQSGIPASEAARKRQSYRNKNADGRWSSDVVRYILRNPLYKGDFRWNKSARVDCFDWKIEGQGTIEIGKLRTDLKDFQKDHTFGVRNEDVQFYIDRQKVRDEWIVIENAVPAIVPSDLFNAVQARFKTYGTKVWRQKNDYKYLMSSALRCGSCGNNITGHRYNKILKTGNIRGFYHYYRCVGDIRKGTHAASKRPMMRLDAIDSVVLDGMKTRVERLLNREELKCILTECFGGYINVESMSVAEIDKEIAVIEKEMDRLIYAHAKFDRPLPEEEVNDLKFKKGSLVTKRNELTASDGHSNPRPTFDINKEAENIFIKVKDVEGILFDERTTPAERIKVREGFLPRAEITWYNDSPARVDLYWKQLSDICVDVGSLAPSEIWSKSTKDLQGASLMPTSTNHLTRAAKIIYFVF